jgi:hypothetical protein
MSLAVLDELNCHREDEESQLPERLRNLSITPSDVERVGKLPEKLKSYHDDRAEHSRGGGYRRGVSMQKNGNIACTRCTEAINTRYREEKGCCCHCCWSCCGRCVEGLKCEQGGRAQE